MNLSGHNYSNSHSLTGKCSTVESIPEEIKKIKIKILNDYLIPLLSNQWSKLYKNLFFVDKLKR